MLSALPNSVVFWRYLQTIWTQIRPDNLSGLIWIQTVWHWWYSWKSFSKKLISKKKSADDKNTWKVTHRASVRRTYAVYYVKKSAAYAEIHIKDVPRTSENSLVRPKMDIETSCRQKNPAHITWFMSRLRIGNSFILFIDHARTSHLTDFESFIDSQCHV